jgi:hypothetical protein
MNLRRRRSHRSGQSDELHDSGRRNCFVETNAIAFMIGKRVYDHLEQVVIDSKVANEISAIVIENV